MAAGSWVVARVEPFGDHQRSMVRWQWCCCSNQFGAGSSRIRARYCVGMGSGYSRAEIDGRQGACCIEVS